MNKTEKILEKYYSSIGEIAHAFYRKYFFEEKLKDGEARKKDFLEEYENDVYRIGAFGWGSGSFSGNNSVFDFFCGSYYFDVNDMYIALKNNIPEKIVKTWYDERVEVAMEDSNAYFPNLYHYFKNGGKK